MHRIATSMFAMAQKQESQAIIAKMSEAEPMAAMNAALDLFKKCAGRGR